MLRSLIRTIKEIGVSNKKDWEGLRGRPLHIYFCQLKGVAGMLPLKLLKTGGVLQSGKSHEMNEKVF